MPDRPALPVELAATGVLAIARARSSQQVVPAVETLVDAGVTCVELTMSTPGALESIAALAERLGSAVCLGAGTVMTAGIARDCLDAGAKFLVAPSAVPDVVEFATTQRVAVLPGALSPSEIVSAWLRGAAAVKLFPAAAVGPQYVRDLRAPLPDIPLVPTGGVTIDDVPRYIDAGAVAVGLGSPLFGDALSEAGDLGALSKRARRLVYLARAACEGRPT